MQRKTVPIGCIVKAAFEGGVLIEFLCNAIKPTKFSVLRVLNMQTPVFVFLLAAVVPSLHRSYAILTTENVKILRGFGFYRPALDAKRNIFLGISSSAVAKKSMVSASGGVCMFFCISKKANNMHFGVLVLPGWADASVLSNKAHMQLEAPS